MYFVFLPLVLNLWLWWPYHFLDFVMIHRIRWIEWNSFRGNCDNIYDFSNCDVAEYWYFITISQSYCGLGWNFVNCSQISPLHTSYFVWGKSPYRYKMTHVQPKTLPETRIPFQLVMINLNYKTILNRKGPQVVSLVMWLMYLVQATARQVKCHPWECEICVNCVRMWRMRRKMWLRLSWRFWRWN